MKDRAPVYRLFCLGFVTFVLAGLIFADPFARYAKVSQASNTEHETEADGDHPDEAARFRNLQLKDERGKIPADGLERARAQMDIMRARQHARAIAAGKPEGLETADLPLTWDWLGPGNIGGRIRSIVVFPGNLNKILVGSVSGGIWMSTNGGALFLPVDDRMANLAISSMVVDPNDANTIYAGTGEIFAAVATDNREGQGFSPEGQRGAGVFKSTDGGNTWAQLATTRPSDPAVCGGGAGITCPWSYVNRLAFAPDGSAILAATGNGIWRSVNGGQSWQDTGTSVPMGYNRFLDVDFDPTNSMRVVTSSITTAEVMGNQVNTTHMFYSVDGGQSFTETAYLGGDLSGANRAELAYAPSDPTKIYASVDRNDGEVFISNDGGLSFFPILATLPPGNTLLGGQGYYDNIIWVNPMNSSMVIIGAVNMYRSINGGQDWTAIANGNEGSPHSDHHMIVAASNFDNVNNKTVYFSNDGGLYKTDDISTAGTPGIGDGWIKLNHNLGITQFYGGAGNASSGVIIGGTQDNGTLKYDGDIQGWTEVGSGDGGYTAVDPADPNYLYLEYTDLGLKRSTNGEGPASYIYCNPAPPIGNGGQCTGTGIMDAFNGANFIAPFILDPNDSNRLLAGGLSLWRSNDIKSPGLPSWNIAKGAFFPPPPPPPPPPATPPPTPAPVPISAIAVSSLNSDLIVVGHNQGQIFLTFDGTSTVPTWSRIDNAGAATPGRFVTRLTIDETRSPNWIYATFGGFADDNVFVTRDLGLTWIDVSGDAANGLPSVPVRSLVINPLNNDFLYVGTETGIFASEDGGTTWMLPQGVPTNVPVDELFWLNGKLVAATHGRGFYQTVEPAFIFGGGSGGPGSACPVAPPGCPCYGIWECPCSWNINREPNSTDDVGVGCMTVTSQFAQARNVRVNNRLTLNDGSPLFVGGDLANYGTIGSNAVEGNNIYVGGDFNNQSGLVTLYSLSAQRDLNNGGIIAVATTIGSGRDFYMGPNSTLSAGHTVGTGGDLSNSGAMVGQFLSVGPYGPHRFSGSGTWDFDAMSIPGTETVSLASDITLDIDSVFVNGTLNVNDKTLTNTGAYFAANTPVLGTGTLKFAPHFGAAQFLGNGPNVNIASGTVTYPSGGTVTGLSIDQGAIFHMNTPASLTVNGDVTVNGAIIVPSGSTPSLIFNGNDFTNNGSVGNLFFLNFNLTGAPKSQTLSGTGSWTPTNVLVGDYTNSATTVTLQNDATFSSSQLATGTGSELNVFLHTLTLTGPMNNFTGKISGTQFGRVRMQPSGGTSFMGTQFGSLTIDPPVEIVSGRVIPTSTFLNGDLTIDAGSMLSPRGVSGMTVSGNLTNNGTMDVFSDSPFVVFNGDTFSNNGSITGNSRVFFGVNYFGPPLQQNLAGAGSWSGSALLDINTPSTTNLQSDLNYNGANLWVDGRINTGAFTLSVPCSVLWSGTGDVVGNIRRTNLGACPGGTFAFGNPFTTIRFDSGVPPDEIAVNLALGPPAGFPNAVGRTYLITPTGGSGYSATLRLHYLDAELNGNNESTLQLFRNDGSAWTQQGATNRSTSDNWVEYLGVTQFSPWTLSNMAPLPSPTTTATGTPSPTPCGTEVLYGISNGFGTPANNKVYMIDPATGTISGAVQVTLPGSTVYKSLALDARPSDGVLFAVVQTVNNDPASRRLVTVNPSTGVATEIGPLNSAMATLAFRANGVLYGATGENPPDPETLFTISTTDASKTLQFPLGNGFDGEALAFHPNGLLYHSSGNGSAIFESIDVDTQTITPIGLSAHESYAMGYSTSLGQMFGSDISGNLYTVNTGTGVRTIVGPINAASTNRGLAFVFSACSTATPTNTPTATPTNTPTATPPSPPLITGNVDYAIVSKAVPGVSLDATGSMPISGMTDSLGNYSLTGFGGGPYTITPSKTTQQCSPPVSNGIFANDAALVSQHVVGLITLTDDELTAAKVSGPDPPTLSSFDAALIAQKVVGLCIGSNHAGEWRFSPEAVDHPGGITTDLVENYRAYLMGDVNGDWNPAGPSRPAMDLLSTGINVTVSVPEIRAAKGAMVTFPLRIDNLQSMSVGSYQFDVQFDPSVVEASRVAASVDGTLSSELTVVSNPLFPGLLKVAVYGPVPAQGDGVYIDLNFRVMGRVGTGTPIHIDGFRFNDGIHQVTAVDGYLKVTAASSKYSFWE